MPVVRAGVGVLPFCGASGMQALVFCARMRLGLWAFGKLPVA
ncbi:MAG: hypothetical protein ACI92Z_001853 [Paracoccaceae bacterium]|jgi:hypothetical protein